MPTLPNYHMDWQCKYCGTKQTVYVGDVNDLTKPDVDAVRCCACKKLELTSEDELVYRSKWSLWDEDDNELPITDAVILMNAYIEDGIPKVGTFKV